jgi:hypothetical protein
MRCRPRWAIGLGLSLAASLWRPGAAYAQSARDAPGLAEDGAACEAAADEAERGFGLPAGMLRAIGIVESGRWQPALNRSAPWPYAIDAGGYDLFMETLEAAVAKVGELRLQGVESIDVGCFQINLMYHPDAFATLREAFDPRANAGYAARFLLSLHARSGSWETAVADYHSAVPELGEPYRARVYAVWQGTPFAPSISLGAARAGGGRGGGGVSVALSPALWIGWTRPPGGGGFVRVAASGGISLGGVRVVVPSASVAANPAAAAPAMAVSATATALRPARRSTGSVMRAAMGRPARRGLPMVFTPSGG